MNPRRPARTLSHTLAALTLTLGLSTASAGDISDQLPELGSSAGALLSPAQEKRLGQAFMRQMRKTEKVVADPALQDYIQTLGQTLVDHSDASGESYHFFLIDNPQINAFAGPGGYIGVYTGLVLTTQSEGELAAVLAHEIAHVTQRHLLRGLEAASDLSGPGIAILLAAIALGVTVGGDAATAAAVGGQAGLLQRQINFTRSNEQEADRIGVETLAGAGYDPREMPAFFSRMAQASQAYSTQLPELLLTHPVTDSRMADTLARAESYPRAPLQAATRYELVRARLLQARIVDPEEAVRDMRQQLAQQRYRDPLAARYALALALQRQGSLDAAAAILDELLAGHPGQMEFVIARADILAERNRHAQAAALLADAVQAAPLNRALGLVYAEALINAGRARAAEEALLQLLPLAPDDPAIYGLLSRAAGAMNKRAKGHEYLALHHYYDGRLDAAILQLEIALRTPEIGFYDASRLEARLAEMKQEQRAEKERRR